MSIERVYGPEEPVAPESTESPTVRETATVTVSKAVDGTKKRKPRKRNAAVHRPHRKVRAETTKDVKVDPRVWKAATEQLVLRPGEKLKIVDAETVITEYIR